MEKNYIAIDLGATSGRVMLAKVGAGNISLEELARFPNHIVKVAGHDYWDILSLYREILGGLKKAAFLSVKIESIGIDTWGVDFALFNKDGALLGNPHCYRDPYSRGGMEWFFTKFTREELFSRTGIQIESINSIFQLAALNKENDAALKVADKILFMPDALSYMLTGNAVTEYSIASTSSLINPFTKQFDEKVLSVLGISAKQFAPVVLPGTVVGTLTREVQEETGLGAIPVMAVGEHDTASAVAAVPATTPNFAYLSSGTWSLMGVELDEPIVSEECFKANLTNEGGVGGKIRFLKNICGMWLLESCRREWPDTEYGALIADAQKSEPFVSLINPDDVSFANPQSMTKAIADYCSKTGQKVPQTQAQFTRCIFESLALRYRQVFDYLKKLSPKPVEVLHIIGGGSRNALVNQFTANVLGIPVVAGPTECTAIGNVMVQAGLSRSEVLASVETVSYSPENTGEWEKIYKKFNEITK
ncbi:MAG: rhamnulokinase [Bacteroidales bacterium]|nr:rhamnulokinase [Bacteroidales bacterium]